jgi:hypothetical protein
LAALRGGQKWEAAYLPLPYFDKRIANGLRLDACGASAGSGQTSSVTGPDFSTAGHLDPLIQRELGPREPMGACRGIMASQHVSLPMPEFEAKFSSFAFNRSVRRPNR